MKYIKLNNLKLPGVNGSSVNLEIDKGDIIAITGKTGSGKSVLLNILAGIVRPEGIGQVLVDGLDPYSLLDEKRLHRICGIVSQDIQDDIIFDNALSDTVFGPENVGRDRALISKSVGNYWKRFKLADKKKREYSELSGSERQKASLSSVLVMHHDILILDDAFSFLDPDESMHILRRIIKSAKKRGGTVIYTSGRRTETELADKLYEIRDGILSADETEKRVNSGIEPAKEGGTSVREAAVGQFRISVTRSNSRDKTGLDNPVDEALLEMKDIFFSYGAERLIEGFSFTFRRGFLYKISAKSSGGLSTLLSLMTGIDKPGAGTVNLTGKAVMAGQFASEYLLSDTVIDEAVYGMEAGGINKKESRTRAKKVLTELGFREEYFARHPGKISYGEKRALLDASVLMTEADLYILDRPFAGLDDKYTAEIEHLILERLAEGRSIIIAE